MESRRTWSRNRLSRTSLSINSLPPINIIREGTFYRRSWVIMKIPIFRPGGDCRRNSRGPLQHQENWRIEANRHKDPPLDTNNLLLVRANQQDWEWHKLPPSRTDQPFTQAKSTISSKKPTRCPQGLRDSNVTSWQLLTERNSWSRQIKAKKKR